MLLRDEGWFYKEIAHALLLSEDAIHNHISEFERYHNLQPKGGGSCEKLSPEQSESLERHLLNHTYLYVKNIVNYVELTYGVHYKIENLTNWFKRHGFSYKKPKLVPGKADFEQQQYWIEEYSKFEAELPDDETICFADGVHPTHNAQLACG